MFTSFSILPLRISILFGLIFSVFGVIIGIYTVFEKLLKPSVPIGYASLFVMVSVFAGVQLIMLGMVGEYIGRIFLSLNRRPQYTISKIYEWHDEN
jgi:undecaprenyl-phosphate 4-deoxy-4-formamido-L-arabinose transferase